MHIDIEIQKTTGNCSKVHILAIQRKLTPDIFNRVFQGGQSDPSVAGLVGASHFGLSMFITPFNTHVMRGFLFGQNFFPKARLSWCIPAVVCILSAPLYNGNRRGKFMRNKVFAMNEAKFWSGEVWRPFTQALYPRSWTSSWWMIACMFPFLPVSTSLSPHLTPVRSNHSQV